jgi:hypothetical protein
MVPFALALLFTSPSEAASYDPDLHWRTITTEHFRITFHQGCEQVADEFSTIVEQVYTEMTDEVGWVPQRRTELTLVDRTDSANGFAHVVPYNSIVVYVTAPEEDANLNYYEEWSRAIFTHEFTHVLHLDSNYGIVRLARAVVGRIATTNDVSPDWLIEGYATFEETRQTNAGRGRAPLADMLKRTAALYDDWPPLGNLDGFQVDTPQGNLRYVFGQDFIQYVADHRGANVWTKWAATYGSHIPILLPTKKVFGSSLQKLYNEWTADTLVEYQAVADRVRAEGETIPRILSADTRASCQSPSFSPDGQKLVWTCNDNRTGNAIWMSDGDGYTPKVLLDRHGAKTFTWRRDSQALVYAGTHTINIYNTWSDIYLLTLGGSVTALTTGARARDPDFSPDGQRLVVVTNHAQDNQIEQLAVDRIRSPLTDVHDHTQFSTPRFSPDGSLLAVSVWSEGRRDIWLYRSSDATPLRRLTEDTAIDVDPIWSADGKWLYFSSDRTGIPNIYAIDLTTEHLWQVTNVLTGAIRPSIRPDGKLIAWQQWSVEGWDIAAMDLVPSNFVDRGPLPRPLRYGTPLAEIIRPPAPLPAHVASWEPGADGSAGGGLEVAGAAVGSSAGAGAPGAGAGTAGRGGLASFDLADRFGYPQSAEAVDSYEDARAKNVFGEENDYPFRIRPTRYNPLPTLIPRYVLPTFATSPFPPRGLFGPYTCIDGVYCPGIQATLSTSASDTLHQFAWNAFVSYRTDADNWSAGTGVTWNRWTPVFSLSASSVATSPSGLFEVDPESDDPENAALLDTGIRYWERRNTATAVVSWPFRQRATVFAQYQISQRYSTDPIPAIAYRPLLPLRGTEGALSAGYRFSFATSAPYAISAEDGKVVSFVGSLLAPWLGTYVLDENDVSQPLTQVQLTGEYQTYHSNPWIPNHVFVGRIAGGVTLGETQYLGNYQLGGDFSDNGLYVTPAEYRRLRGFPFGYDPGDMYWLATGEYRFPIVRIDRGFGTLPAFFQNISGKVFVDAGNAFSGTFFGAKHLTPYDIFAKPLVGVGGEASLQGIILWGLSANATVGYAVGLTEGGITPLKDPLAPLYIQLGGAL